MHDILGGYNPIAKAITGIVNNPRLSGQLPFAKPYGAVLPINSGVKVDNAGGFPFLTSLSGTTSNIFQNNGMNGARLPVGSTIEKLMFGTMTVVDDELTIGPELSSGRVGKAQGFYVSSSVDGKSQVMALTAMFETGGYADTICFFGVHLLGVSESQMAVMGGTGKFVNAKGYAIIKTLPPSKNQVQTDGVETVVQFTVYVTY
ncbi:dirigent protein 25-like [Chenopodium quinoa]|uniref:dirigent protein 25-like n=1 Tax=Chenopodium quinoa TaxID=63459 RepID=UPI000B76CE95|nr:dirigent protein 25-like [Chenopodium quinoa]